MPHCPECGDEYREGIEECADCRVPLVTGEEAADADADEAEDAQDATVRVAQVGDAGQADRLVAELENCGLEPSVSEDTAGTSAFGRSGTLYNVVVPQDQSGPAKRIAAVLERPASLAGDPPPEIGLPAVDDALRAVTRTDPAAGLESDVGLARRRAVLLLADASDPLEPVGEALLGAVRSDSPALTDLARVYGSLVTRAERSGDDDAAAAAVGRLLDITGDEDPGVRARAAFAVGLTRRPEAEDTLLALLRDDHEAVRTEAADALYAVIADSPWEAGWEPGADADAREEALERWQAQRDADPEP